MPGPVAALAGGSIAGGLIQGRAAGKAADATQQAARESVEEQRRQFNLGREDMAPYREMGYNALAGLGYELGIAPRPTLTETPEIQEISSGGGASGGSASGGNFGNDDYTFAFSRGQEGSIEARPVRRGDMVRGGQSQQQASTRFQVGDQTFDTRDAAEEYVNNLDGGFDYRGFQETPGYQYALEQDQKGLERMAAARGMRLSGATLDEAGRRRQGRANQEYGTFVNRLAALSGTGQTAVNTGAQLGANTASNIGNSLMAGGRAKASGYMGQANAISGIGNNLAGLYGAAQGGQFGASPGFGISPSPAGLKAWGY